MAFRKQVGLSIKTFEEVPCAICGTHNTRLLATKGEFGWDTYVSICRDCGLVFLNPRWTKEDYQNFYVAEYDKVLRSDPAKVEEKEKRKGNIVWQRVKPFFPDGAKNVLDIGCAMGWTLAMIKQDYPEVNIFGIEPSERYRKHAHEVVGVDVIATDVDSDWYKEYQNKFDVIIMRHVAEHLLDPLGAFRKIAHVLSPKGVFYLATPDMMHPDGSLTSFWYRSVHTYYFAAETLQRLMAKAGMEALTLKSENAELWGIFHQNDNVPEIPTSVYQKQLRVLRQYKLKRGLRAFLRLFAPQKISKYIPDFIKRKLPKTLKQKFRHLVYRH